MSLIRRGSLTTTGGSLGTRGGARIAELAQPTDGPAVSALMSMIAQSSQ